MERCYDIFKRQLRAWPGWRTIVNAKILELWLDKTMNSFPLILLVVLLGSSGPMTCYANGQANLAAEDVEAWLEAYEEAWEKLGPEKASLIFTEDATYQVDPYMVEHQTLRRFSAQRGKSR